MPKYRVSEYDGELPESSGGVSLLLSGFYQQSIVTPEMVVEAVEALPEEHIVELKVIKYDPERTMQEVIAQAVGKTTYSDSTWAEYFHGDLKGILLYRFDTLEQFYRILYHEIAHYVYYKVMPQAWKVQWVNELYPINPYVSPYATGTASEDFAECYSFFCVHPHILAQNPAKLKFMAETVFGLEPGSYHFENPNAPEADRYDGVGDAMPEIY